MSCRDALHLVPSVCILPTPQKSFFLLTPFLLSRSWLVQVLNILSLPNQHIGSMQNETAPSRHRNVHRGQAQGEVKGSPSREDPNAPT